MTWPYPAVLRATAKRAGKALFKADIKQKILAKTFICELWVYPIKCDLRFRKSFWHSDSSLRFLSLLYYIFRFLMSVYLDSFVNYLWCVKGITMLSFIQAISSKYRNRIICHPYQSIFHEKQYVGIERRWCSKLKTTWTIFPYTLLSNLIPKPISLNPISQLSSILIMSDMRLNERRRYCCFLVNISG